MAEQGAPSPALCSSSGHWRVAFVAQFGWMSAFCTLMITLLNSQYWSVELQLDQSATASIKAWLLGMSGAGGLVLGWIGDRTGRRVALAVTSVIAALGAWLVSQADSQHALWLAVIVAGFGVGGQWAAGQTLLGELVPAKRRAWLGTIAQSGAPVGLILSAILTLRFSGPEALGWRGTERLLLLGLALLPLLLLVPESEAWRKTRQHRQRRDPLLNLLRADVLPTFAAAFVVTLCAMANYWCTVTWLPEYMKKTWQLSVPGSIGWFLCFGCGSLLGYLLFSWTTARIGRRGAFSLFSLLMAAGAGALLFGQDLVRDQEGFVLVFATTAGIGTGLWSCFGPLYTDLFPTHLRNSAGGVLMNGTRAICLLAPLLPPLFGGDLGAGVGLGCLFGLLAAGTIWLLPAREAVVVQAD